MTKYLAGVLTVIAAGVLLIAYGLLAPQIQASFAAAPAMAVTAPVAMPAAAAPQAPASWTPLESPAAVVRQRSPVAVPAVQVIDEAPPSARTVVRDEPQRVTRTVVSPPRRDWKKTARAFVLSWS